MAGGVMTEAAGATATVDPPVAEATTAAPADVTDDQLAAIGVSRKEWDDLLPAEREALMTEEDASAHGPLTTADIEAAKKVAAEDAAAAATAAPAADDKTPAAATPPVEKDTREFVAMPALPSQADIDQISADLKARRDEIAAAETKVEEQLNALDKKLEDGDITQIDYNKARRPIDRQMAEITKAAAVLEADRRIAGENIRRAKADADHVMMSRYEFSKQSFWDDDRHETLYRHEKLGETARSLHDQFTRTVAQMPGNENRSFAWLLREGDKRVRAFLAEEIAAEKIGEQAAAGGKPAAEAKPAAAKTPPGRAPDLSKIPQTLGAVPVAASNGAGGEFASLEELMMDPTRGIEYLAALEKLSADQRARFERGA